MLALVVPVQANADEIDEYTFEEWCSDNGLNVKASDTETNTSAPFSIHSTYNSFIVKTDTGTIRLFYYYGNCFLVKKTSNYYMYYKSSSFRSCQYYVYDYIDNGWKYVAKGSPQIDNSTTGHKITQISLSDEILYTNLDIYENVDKSIVFYPKSIYKPVQYSFQDWCYDAGLNCGPSSYESNSVIPFWYEPDSYDYIVRKNLTGSPTSGIYQVTMIQNNDELGHYPYYFEVNNIGYLGIAGEYTSVFTVRNFYYYEDGWKYIERFDISELPFDNTNVSFTDNTVFIYSDCDIYGDREASTS